MKYISVCSGIEAATVAWHGLGWKAAAYSEIEAFPSAVLAHHYPDIPNVGDMTKFKEWNIEPGTIDLLVGGTPCQSFSVAGLRKGLADPRGNLALTYCAILDHLKPRWFVWENVPGVLSSGGGRDFGSFLGAVAELGYGFAYRVLDAQFFGVAQRRRRVFVVGYLGDWRPAAKVLFERESLRGDPAPSREKGKAVAGTITARFGRNGGASNDDVEAKRLIPHGLGHDGQCARALTAAHTATGRLYPHEATFVSQPITFGAQMSVPQTDVDLVQTLQAKNPMAVLQPIPLDLRNAARNAEKHDEMNRQSLGVGQPGDPAHTVTSAFVHGVAIGTDCYNGAITGDVAATMGTPGSSVNASGPTVMVTAPTLTASNDPSRSPQSSEITAQVAAVVQATAAVAFTARDYGNDATTELAPTMRSLAKGADGHQSGSAGLAVMQAMQVRRLTPVECERLQGFPDNYTAIPWRKKPADECPDGPRYKALGNSMAVPVMAWIGRRIQEFEAGNAS